MSSEVREYCGIEAALDAEREGGCEEIGVLGVGSRYVWSSAERFWADGDLEVGISSGLRVAILDSNPSWTADVSSVFWVCAGSTAFSSVPT
jgi:hypothetical protein